MRNFVFCFILCLELGLNASDVTWIGGDPEKTNDMRVAANWSSVIGRDTVISLDGSSPYHPQLNKGKCLYLKGINFTADDELFINSLSGLKISGDVNLDSGVVSSILMNRGRLSVGGSIGTGGGVLNYSLLNNSWLDLSNSSGVQLETKVNVFLRGGNNLIDLNAVTLSSLNSDAFNDTISLTMGILTLDSKETNEIKGCVIDEYPFQTGGLKMSGQGGILLLSNGSNAYTGPTIISNGALLANVNQVGMLGDSEKATNTLILDGGRIQFSADICFSKREVNILDSRNT